MKRIYIPDIKKNDIFGETDELAYEEFVAMHDAEEEFKPGCGNIWWVLGRSLKDGKEHYFAVNSKYIYGPYGPVLYLIKRNQ